MFLQDNGHHKPIQTLWVAPFHCEFLPHMLSIPCKHAQGLVDQETALGKLSILLILHDDFELQPDSSLNVLYLLQADYQKMIIS